MYRVLLRTCMSNNPQEILLSPPRGSTKPLKINKRSKSDKQTVEPLEEKAEKSKAENGRAEKVPANLEPPPMTREPSQDLPSQLHTPTDELASSGPASSGPSASDGYMPCTETDMVS